jgi:hypothetical protein
MSKIAIDIALLPPKHVMDKVIYFNQTYGPKVGLNETDRLPHITLSQAIIEDADLEEAKIRLAEISKKFKAMDLEAKIVNEPDSFFRVSTRDRLLKLHEAVMKALEDLVSYDARAEFFLDDEVRERSLGWVSNFPRDGAFDKFDPHISIAVKDRIDDENLVNFTVDRLVICHLGNFNTCRKILFETRLA